MIRKTVFVFAVVAALPLAASRRRAAEVPPNVPPCTMVTGTGAVTFTYDEGRHVAPTSEILLPTSYTYGLTTVPDDPDTLAAWNRDELLLSNDGGCSWRTVAVMGGSGFPPRLEAAQGGRIYAWSDNRVFSLRYDARGVRLLKQPVPFVGFAADAANGEHLRAAGDDGSIWESNDAGETWDPIGALHAKPLYYRFAFERTNLDHVVAGTVSDGAFVSRDGGRTWVKATGLTKGTVNVFELVISPADPMRVWAMGVDNEQSDSGHPSHGRHIFLSDDGGATYRPVVDEAPGVKLINGPTMAADPSDRDVLYFVYGTHFYGYGTDLFRYDASNGLLTMTHNDHDNIDAIAFSRRDPRVLYLGLEAEVDD